MSAFHWPWPVLGIAPTDDRKTIREAYARLLKALDPDAATEAFMELRDARDAALSGQFLHPPRAEGEEYEDDYGLGTPLPDGTSHDGTPRTAPLSDPEPAEQPVFTVEYDEEDDRRFNRTVELFLGDGDLTLSETYELKQLVQRHLDDERMADLGHYARIEGWLAQLLAERYPRGAELFTKVADYFNWYERGHELGVHPAIPWLLDAHEGQVIAQKLDEPTHHYHREWVELSRGNPAGRLSRRGVDKSRMADLIATIRRDHPWLEQRYWQADLVARWEEEIAKVADTSPVVRGPNPWIWMVFVAVFLTVVGQMIGQGGADRSQVGHVIASVPSGPTQEQVASDAVAGFLERNFAKSLTEGRSVETLEAKNPKIYAKLHADARTLPDDQKLADNILMKDLTDSYFTAVHRLPHDRQIADARLRVATMKRLQDNPEGCFSFISDPIHYARSGNASLVLTETYRNHIFAVVHDDIAGVKFSFAPKEFRIPGELVEKLAKRSGLSEARLREAISSPYAPHADICRARTSLLELMTEVPRNQSEKILPALL